MEPKKNPRYVLERKSPLFYSIGVVVALLCVTAAFEYRMPYDPVDLTAEADDWEELPPITLTKWPEPEPPKPIEQKKTRKAEKASTVTAIVKATVDIPDDLIQPVIDIDDDPLAGLDFGPDEDDEPTDNPFFRVESMPAFPGGQQAFYEYVKENLKYPSTARKMGVEGKVTVSFVIDEHGKTTDVKVIDGIGMGCDEEAIRIIENAPRWTPGKQRGRPVKVYMALPIFFKLAR